MFRKGANKLKKVDRPFADTPVCSPKSQSAESVYRTPKALLPKSRRYNPDFIFICRRCLDKMLAESYNRMTDKMKQL